MADQDWKTGGLNRQKYVVLKPCCNCGGDGVVCPCLGRECNCLFYPPCEDCSGTGLVKPEDENACYFVLRIDCGPDGPHDPNAREALLRYAKYVRDDNPKFADDILTWLVETVPAVK